MEILTETANNGFTTIVMALDVAGLFDVQGSDEVRMQLTTSPLAGV